MLYNDEAGNIREYVMGQSLGTDRYALHPRHETITDNGHAAAHNPYFDPHSIPQEPSPARMISLLSSTKGKEPHALISTPYLML
jgi:hypothetical protein